MKKFLQRIAALALAALGLSGITVNAAQADTIVVFGASGNIGGMITQEALSRGHTVIGVSRNPNKFKIDNPNFRGEKGDVTDPESFRALAQQADSIVISVQGSGKGNAPELSTHAIAAKTAVAVLSEMENAPYVLQVGGATTLNESREAMVNNLPFPAKEGSAIWGMLFGHWEALQTYRASDIAWTVLTPPLNIMGPERDSSAVRTGQYRTSTDTPVRDSEGNSRVSRQDLAVAAVDELEKKDFSGRRFTVGY